MDIPDFLNMQAIDLTTGKFTTQWSLLMTQLFTELQIGLSNEGIKMPELPTTDINKLTDAEMSTSRVVYDNTTDEFKGNVNGTWKVFTLT